MAGISLNSELRPGPTALTSAAMPVRIVAFWIHLISGLCAGAVIFFMLLTGLAIACEEEIRAGRDDRTSRIGGAKSRNKALFPKENLKRQIDGEHHGFQVALARLLLSGACIPANSNLFSGAILQAVCLDERSPELQARVWMACLHPGAAFGFPEKTITRLATAACGILVWTGFSPIWHRFFAWSCRGARSPPA